VYLCRGMSAATPAPYAAAAAAAAAGCATRGRRVEMPCKVLLWSEGELLQRASAQPRGLLGGMCRQQHRLCMFRPPEPSGPRPTGRATTTRRRRGVLSSARVCQRYSDEQSFTLHCLLEAAIINYTQMDSSEPGQNRRLQHRGILRSPSCSGPRIRAEVPPIVSPGEKWPAAAPPRRLYLLRGAFCGSFLEENLHRRTQDGLEVRSITQLIDYLVAKVPNGRVRTATLPDVPGRNTVVHFIPN
jgi:hypothetical protein